MLDQPRNAYLFTSTATEFRDENALLVWRWEGTDALSEGYCFHINLAQRIKDVNDNPIENLVSPRVILGKRATFFNPKQKFKWHGIVSRMTELGSDTSFRYVRVSLEPKWVLGRLDHTSRIHASENKDISLSDLTKFTLQRSGLDTSQEPTGGDGEFVDYQWRVNTAHEDLFKQDFICQYDESSYDFLSRHLERAGIHYEFQQGEHREKIIFRTADMKDFPPDKKKLVWKTKDPQIDSETENKVDGLARTSQVSNKIVRMDAYDPDHVTLDLKTLYNIDANPLETNDVLFGRHVTFGELATTAEQQKKFAKLRGQRIECAHFRLSGTGYSPSLRAGDIAYIEGYSKNLFAADPTIDQNNIHTEPFLTVQIIETRHKGYQAVDLMEIEDIDKISPETQWTAIPEFIDFVPECVTPWPRIPGIVTGVIESDKRHYHPTTENLPQREYPYLSKNGCYRVRFHFAENEQNWQNPPLDKAPFDITSTEPDRGSAAPAKALNSGWLRMATPYSGTSRKAESKDNATSETFGMYFPLNEGAEVLISFLNGDPDRPVIIGSVPNSDNVSLFEGEDDTQNKNKADHPTAETSRNKIGGVVTQGGNVLAFNLAENNQTIALSSPVADSHIVIGGDTKSNDTQGILLRSEKAIIIHGDEKVEHYGGKGLRRIYDLSPVSEEKSTFKEHEKNHSGFSTNLAISKPNFGANINPFAASASISIDLAIKLGLSFSAILSADWAIKFATSTDINFLEEERIRKSESTKTKERTALVLKDKVTAGTLSEEIIYRYSYTKTSQTTSQEVNRQEAGTAIVLSVLDNITAPNIPTSNSFSDVNNPPQGLLAALNPSVHIISPLEKTEPADPPTFDDPEVSPSVLPQPGGEKTTALSTLRLTKDEVELKAVKKMELKVKDSSGDMALTTGTNGKLELVRGASHIALDGTGISASSSKDAKIDATGDITLTAGKELYFKSSANVTLKSTALFTVTSNNLVKLG